MPRPAAIHMEHVEDALHALSKRGKAVEYVNGRVRGFADLRRITGGDASRVRAMAVLLLERDGGAIGCDEIRKAETALRRGGTGEVRSERLGAHAMLARLEKIFEGMERILRRDPPTAAANWCGSNHEAGSAAHGRVPKHLSFRGSQQDASYPPTTVPIGASPVSEQDAAADIEKLRCRLADAPQDLKPVNATIDTTKDYPGNRKEKP